MPRKARIDVPGALHHIICRGIERRKIFLNNIDRMEQTDSPICSVYLERRAIFRTPAVLSSACGCFFLDSNNLRHLCNGSATASHTRRFTCGLRNEDY